MKGPLFYSKILLFGEYGIIEDSKGLSIPYNFFKGALKFSKVETKDSKKSNKILLQFHWSSQNGCGQASKAPNSPPPKNV